MQSKELQFLKSPINKQQAIEIAIKFGGLGSSLKQQGLWDASTNTPTLTNGIGTIGYYWVVSVGGTVNFGAGNITFTVGDWVYYNTSNVYAKFETGVDYVPVNKAGDTMTGNLSAPKVAIGTTDYPAIDTVGEGLTAGASLDGVTQTTRTSRSRIGNAELNFVVNHLHSASNWIKNLFLRSNGDTSTHVSVTNGQVISGNYYAGRYQSGGTGSYYLAASDEVGIDDTGTISATSMPGKRTRSITPNGSKTPVVFETVSNNGNVAFSKTMQYLQGVNAQIGTTYTLVASDYAKLITFNNASPITLTVPQQSTLATTDGFWCKARNLGVGAVTIVKQGSETLDGNTTLITGAEALIERPTTTKWAVSYGTATVIEQSTIGITGTLTNAKVYDAFIAPDNVTIIGFSLRNTSATTAGTYTVAIDGTTVTGLSAIANSTTRTRTDPTALNTMTYQQVLTYTPAGSTLLVDAFITVFYTRLY